MAIQCRLVEPDRSVPGWRLKLQDGDMFYATPEETEDLRLSDAYLRERASVRPPLWVILPGGDYFCVDQQPTDSRDGHGWDVSGEPPNITVHPSINAGSRFHGWLKNGVLE